MQKESLGKYIASIYRSTQAIINKKFEGYDIGSGQHEFLYIICNNEGITQKDLSDKLNVGKATTAKSVKNLEENGYIRRERYIEDKRFYRLYLTDKGREIAPLIKATFREMLDIYGVGFSDEEYIHILDSLKKIRLNLQNAREDIDSYK